MCGTKIYYIGVVAITINIIICIIMAILSSILISQCADDLICDSTEQCYDVPTIENIYFESYTDRTSDNYFDDTDDFSSIYK